MIFAAPLVLAGLLALPALYFLLRLTPPAARLVVFPPLALLRDLRLEERTPHRMPFWLLFLRLLAAGLLIVGLAGPSLHPAPALPGRGPVLLVIDNGWASAANWPERRAAALRVVAGAARAGRGVAVLAVARNLSNQAPQVQAVMRADSARQVVLGLQPSPWPEDRAGAMRALTAAPLGATVIYLADGITDGPDFGAFFHALRPARVFSDGVAADLLTPGSLTAGGELSVHLAAGPLGSGVLAEAAVGEVLALADFDNNRNAVIRLPDVLSARIARLVVAGVASAGGTLLLDSRSHGALVGLSAGAANAESAYTGALFFVRRALPAGAQVFTGGVSALIADKANVIILADKPLGADDESALRDFVLQGGDVIRFAGPLTAGGPDDFAPDPLLAGDRRLGGALTWSAPQGLAPFDGDSPFEGLSIGGGEKTSRQVLADPTRLDTGTVWARLADGTPLVLGKTEGRGYLVSILTTANADWSNLALSGLYPDMLARLIALSQGAPARPGQVLPLKSALLADGVLAPAASAATITMAGLNKLMVSPLAPPGLYGADGTVVALNLGGHVPPVTVAPLPNAAPLSGQAPQQDFGAPLLAAAAALLALDLLISLRIRGVLRVPGLAMLLFMTIHPAKAQDAALNTALAYVITGNAATDQISADGLSYLSATVSAHSSTRLAAPTGVTPGITDLNLYPLIYWPVTPTTIPPAPAACTALNSYMQYGGLLVIDTQGGDPDSPGSGAGFAPGARSALQRITACLALPPLEPLTTANVLAHCFYIVRDFPGRFTGAPIYIATAAARDSDGVTPILIGQNDWAGAWAHDETGNPEQTPIPDGEVQRATAERFGTNLVIYALTGSYKADQANLPALLDKLGQ